MRAGDAVHRVRPRGPRSSRARVTLVATLVVGALLGAALVVTAVALRAAIEGHFTETAARVARHVAVSSSKGRLPDPLPADDGVLLIQVVSDPGGEVVAATAPLRGRAPISRLRSGDDDNRVDGRVCRDDEVLSGCAIIVGFEVVTETYGDVTVYAAVPEPWLLSSGLLPGALAALGSVLMALVAWGIWRTVGRTLAPVARIEAEMADITASDLARRVPVPDTGDEIERLARTINATLDRLERSVDQQRGFVADASHELRTPITGLRTRLELALDDPEDGDLLETVRHALSDTDRLHRVVEDLLALARLDSGVEPGRVPLDLAELVEGELARRAPRVPVRTDLEPGVRVVGNRLQLARALVNLLTNADRHAGAKVEVTVRADRVAGEAVLEVRDDGPGIPDGDRERIFERFTRLDAARSRDAGGSGLGLPIAREIVARHGGLLYVAAGDQPGARFVLRLPLEPGPPEDR
ncbi:sensor histidine kinase [Actinomadura kijaniata]|uniref:sensor histidine kinase n=1 Tax=Actinomadura kijaniata TaxID=46161 RepID=UPI003F1A1591